MLLGAALALGVALSAPVPTRADDASESRTRRELGQEYYRQGRYQEALDMFLEAYRLVPVPTLAHDVAQTYALLDRPVQAFNWYRTFLDVSLGDARLAEARTETEAAMGSLRPLVALLDLSTEPAGAAVFVDRVDLGSWGTAPILLAVPAGMHTLTLRAPGHHDGAASIEARLGATTPVAVTLLPILGAVLVTSEPSGATIENERTGQALGTTPLAIELPVGELRIRAHLPGWLDAERTVDVVEDRETTVTMGLAREASTVAVLSVEGEPPGALVLVDGNAVGIMPLTIDSLSVGTHEVTVRSEGAEPVVRQIVLEAGGATRLAVTLRRVASWEWPTWRWLSYGVGLASLVGGGIAGGIALTARDDFFANPSRSGLDSQRQDAGIADALFTSGAVILAVTLVLELALQPPARSEAQVSLDR